MKRVWNKAKYDPSWVPPEGHSVRSGRVNGTLLINEKPPAQLPLTGMRPVFIVKIVSGQQVREFIEAHDQWYLSEKRAWKRRAANEHPDRSKRSWRFRKLLAKFQAWKLSERKWYAERGLMPPDWKGKDFVPLEQEASHDSSTALIAPHSVESHI